MARPYACVETPVQYDSVGTTADNGVCKVTERELLTSRVAVSLAQTLCGAGSFESAIQGMFRVLGRSLHPSRVGFFEWDDETSGDSLEWHAEGLRSRTDGHKNVVKRAYKSWIDLCDGASVLEMSDGFVYTPRGERRFQAVEKLWREGVGRALVATLRGGDSILGLLYVENYHVTEGVDAPLLLETIAPFVGARVKCQRAMRELEFMGHSDVLTGLLNRRGICQAAEETLSEKADAPYALVLIDIDDFKVINDLCGHDIGDKALQSLAQTLEQTFPKGTVLGRNGGDEFVALIIGENSSKVATILGTLERRDLSVDCDEGSYPFSLSIGYVESYQVADLQQAMSKADAALYAVKLAGKAGFRKYTDEMLDQHRTQLGFTHRDIAENIPGAVMVHRTANGEILYANDELISLMECDDLKDFFDYTGGFYDGVTHPDDRGRIRRQLAAAAQGSVAGSKSYTEFRVHTKGGKTYEVACVGKFAKADGIGDVCYDLITGRGCPLGVTSKSRNRKEQ